MFGRQLSLAAAVALVCAASALAFADESLNAQIATSTGYSDNILGAAEVPGVDTTEPDTFFLVTPGLVFSQETRRFVHVGTYTFGGTLYATHSEANSYSNRLAYQMIYAASPRSEIQLTLGGSHGRTNTFRLDNGTDVDPELLPDTGQTYLSTSVQGTYRLEINRDWQFSEAASVRGFRPLDDNASQGANNYITTTTGLDRKWVRDQLGANMRINYNINGSSTASDGTTSDGQRELIFGPELRWLHDFSFRWSGELRAGVLGILRADDFKRGLTVPTGRASVRYTRREGSIQLAYRHSVQPNIFVAQISASDQVQLRGALPIPWVDRMSFATSMAYQRGRILDLENQTLEGTTELLVLDLALSWRFNDSLSFSLRGQRSAQACRECGGMVGVDGVVTNQIVFTLAARYPDRQAAIVPLRQSGRVDGGDEDSFGDVNDPNSQTSVDPR